MVEYDKKLEGLSRWQQTSTLAVYLEIFEDLLNDVEEQIE